MNFADVLSYAMAANPNLWPTELLQCPDESEDSCISETHSASPDSYGSVLHSFNSLGNSSFDAFFAGQSFDHAFPPIEMNYVPMPINQYIPNSRSIELSAFHGSECATVPPTAVLHSASTSPQVSPPSPPSLNPPSRDISLDEEKPGEEESRPKNKRGRPRLKPSPTGSSNAGRPLSHKERPVARVPHNEVERKYRQGLNSELERLRRAVPTLPQSNEPDVTVARPSKAMVLSAAIEYIKQIERERDEAAEAVERNKERIRQGMMGSASSF